MNKFQMECIAKIESIELLNEFVHFVLALEKCNQVDQIAFAVNEAIINAVDISVKTFGSTSTAIIQLEMFVTESEVTIHVIDHAGGMSKEGLAFINSLNFEDIGFNDRGRGILFMKHMMDQFWFEQLSGGKFLVGMTKKIEKE